MQKVLHSLLIILLLLFLFINLQQVIGYDKVSLNKFHSGVYTQPGEEYAGAFFISKSRFLAAVQGIQRARFPEAIIFNTIKLRNSCDFCENFLTRDYFDFSVEHLSSTTNVLNAIALSEPERLDIFQLISDHLERHVHFLRNQKVKNGGSSTTLAVVAFSDSEANFNTSNMEGSHTAALRKIRHNFFKATIYGVWRHFSKIIVYVSKSKDKELILSWSLPLLEVIDISDVLAKVPKKDYFRGRGVDQMLPKYALLDTARNLGKMDHGGTTQLGKLWNTFTSIFYTEGDQILHLRKLKYFYRLFEASEGQFLFLPHRLQTLPLYENFPSKFQGRWKYRKVGHPVELIVHNSYGGSCCDNGRLNLPGCGNWWYFCERWGVRNYTTWLKFGENDFTNALVTEHQGMCAYNESMMRCRLPPNCTISSQTVPKGVSKWEREVFLRKFLRDNQACPENVHYSTAAVR